MSRWRPFQSIGPTEGASVVGFQVGSVTGPTIDRGFVESFDSTKATWTLVYNSGYVEIADLDALNRRVRLRYEFDMNTISSQEKLLPPLSSRFTALSATFDELLTGCDGDWDNKHNPRSFFKSENQNEQSLFCFIRSCLAWFLGTTQFIGS